MKARELSPVDESFLHGFRASYNRDGRTCEVFKNPTRKEYRQVLGKGYQVRAFVVGDDLLIWDVFSALHQTVREELKLGTHAIPLNLYGMIGQAAAANITDNTRNTPWWHDPYVADAVEESGFIRKNFKEFEVSYYDGDIVGDWRSLADDDEE